MTMVDMFALANWSVLYKQSERNGPVTLEVCRPRGGRVEYAIRCDCDNLAQARSIAREMGFVGPYRGVNEAIATPLS